VRDRNEVKARMTPFNEKINKASLGRGRASEKGPWVNMLKEKNTINWKGGVFNWQKQPV